MNKCFLLLLWLLTSVVAVGQLKLPRLIRDSMILQRDAPVALWGWAAAHGKVTIKFNQRQYSTKANADGKWLLKLPPVKAGGPYSMTIAAGNSITLNNILFGDVWLCSGQSNMVHQLDIHDVTYARDIREANYPAIRQFWVPTLSNMQGPQQDLPAGSWKAAVGEDVRPFSAVAFFFVRALFEKEKVPIGIINASVGGTPIEAWISEDGLNEFPAILRTLNTNKDTAYTNNLYRLAAAAHKRTAPLPPDEGTSGPLPWYAVNYTPAHWRRIAIPGYWEDQGVRDLNGVVWYRKEIDVPAAMAGKAAQVYLGRIVDADVLYINGKQVGSTGYMYPQRRYKVPAGLLTSGPNTFVIRVTNNNGKGGFVPDKPYYLFAGTDTVDLMGYWQYKVGQVFEPVAPAPGSMGIAAQNQPAALFNAMIAPVIPYTVKGFVWYQGESNTGRAAEYAQLQPAQIADWRRHWQQDTLPFLYVQLPGFMEVNYLPGESQWAAFREAQLRSLSVPHTAMTVAIDLGEWNDIHPDNKRPVGERLSLAARALVYGEKELEYSGPLYSAASIEADTIRLSFTHTGSGLMTNDGAPLRGFAIAGADHKFVWAHARMDGNKVVVWSERVAAPQFVRYAWADNPDMPNLYNKEGLPASPFRTDK